MPWHLLPLSSSLVLVPKNCKGCFFPDSVLVLSKLLEWCVGLCLPVLLMERCGQSWSGEVLGAFAGQCRDVPCRVALVWPALLVWAAEQEEKVGNEFARKKKVVEEFLGKVVLCFRVWLGTFALVPPSVPPLLWQTSLSSPNSHPTIPERCGKSVCPQPTWPSSGYRPGMTHRQ